MERVRARRIAVAASVAVVALGLAAGTAALRAEGSVAQGGPGLRIAVVTPPAPVVKPGAVMEVGDLTDGYVHRTAPPPERVEWVEFEPVAWQDPPLPQPRPVQVDVRDAAPQGTIEPARVDSMGLGFEPVAEVDRRVRTPPRAIRVEAPQQTIVVEGERTALFY